MRISDNTSNTINYLKCILCIGVVFIHARFFPGLSVVEIENTEKYNVYNAIDFYFNARFLNSTCVPLFFLISGYLFFINIPESFDLNVFRAKWRSRIKSILIPYLICNGIFLIINASLSLKHGDFKPLDLITAFWCYHGSFPIVNPTWYLRDLLVICLFAPLIWFFIKYTKSLLPILLCLCWFNDLWPEIPGFGIRSFLFFTIGSNIAMRKDDIIDMVNPKAYWLFWCPLFAILYGLFIYNNLALIHKLSILASFPVWICLASLTSSIANVKCSKALVSGTFFVFLYHFSIAHRVTVLLSRFIGVSEPSIIISYIGGALLTSIILLTIYYMGRKILPRLFTILVGGR